MPTRKSAESFIKQLPLKVSFRNLTFTVGLKIRQIYTILIVLKQEAFILITLNSEAYLSLLSNPQRMMSLGENHPKLLARDTVIKVKKLSTKFTYLRSDLWIA